MMIKFMFSKLLAEKSASEQGRRISQQEVADAVGVSRAAVSQWTRGISRIDFDRLDKLCGYLECEPGDLLVRTNGR